MGDAADFARLVSAYDLSRKSPQDLFVVLLALRDLHHRIAVARIIDGPGGETVEKEGDVGRSDGIPGPIRLGLHEMILKPGALAPLFNHVEVYGLFPYCLDHEVGRGIIAHDYHEVDSVLERNLKPVVELQEDARSAHLILFTQDNPIVKPYHIPPGFPLGRHHDRNPDDRCCSELDIRVQSDASLVVQVLYYYSPLTSGWFDEPEKLFFLGFENTCSQKSCVILRIHPFPLLVFPVIFPEAFYPLRASSRLQSPGLRLPGFLPMSIGSSFATGVPKSFFGR